MVQEKIKTMLMQNFGGQNKEHYGIFESEQILVFKETGAA